jgi:hypothetical protein
MEAQSQDDSEMGILTHGPNLILRLAAEQRPANPDAIASKDSKGEGGCKWVNKSDWLSLP